MGPTRAGRGPPPATGRRTPRTKGRTSSGSRGPAPALRSRPPQPPIQLQGQVEFGALFYRYMNVSPGPPDNPGPTLKYGASHPRARPKVSHARTPEGLRHGHVGRLLHGAREAAPRSARRCAEDAPGEVPVLLWPRTHDPAGGARVSEGRPPERARLVGPLRPEQVSCAPDRGRPPPPRDPAVPPRERHRRARGDRGDAGPRHESAAPERLPSPGGHHRVQATVLGPHPGHPIQVHPDLQELRGEGGRVDLPSALAAHRHG